MSTSQKKVSKDLQLSTIAGFGVSVFLHLIILAFVGTVIIFEGKVPQHHFMGDLMGAELASDDDLDVPLMEEEPMDVQMDESNLEMMADNFQETFEPSLTTSDIIMSTASLTPSNNMPLNVTSGPVGPQMKLTTGGAKGRKNQPGLPSGVKTIFGYKQAFLGALEGTMIDFKQTSRGEPTGMSVEQFNREIREFASKKSWSLDRKNDYYVVDEKMYATHIYFPLMQATEAPKAYGVEGVVEPSRWAIIYKGRFVAPTSGRFRFWGSSDDNLYVRIDGKPVLDAGLHVAGGREKSAFLPEAKSNREYRLGTTSAASGPWIDLTAGSNHKIEILVAESPGGKFFAYLFVEQQGKKYKKGHGGRPLWPLFQTQNADIDIKPSEPEVPEYGARPVIFSLESS